MYELSEMFDFAYDWEVLHHIYPEDRERYIEVANLQNPGATYFSVCFAEAYPQLGGKGKYRSPRSARPSTSPPPRGTAGPALAVFCHPRTGDDRGRRKVRDAAGEESRAGGTDGVKTPTDGRQEVSGDLTQEKDQIAKDINK
jgi:hypothetical protein